MNSNVLLNLLNNLRKRDQMGGLSSSLLLFLNEKHKMLDSIYHMTLKLL